MTNIINEKSYEKMIKQTLKMKKIPTTKKNIQRVKTDLHFKLSIIDSDKIVNESINHLLRKRYLDVKKVV